MLHNTATQIYQCCATQQHKYISVAQHKYISVVQHKYISVEQHSDTNVSVLRNTATQIYQCCATLQHKYCSSTLQHNSVILNIDVSSCCDTNISVLHNTATQMYQCCTTQRHKYISVAKHSNTPDDKNWCLILMCCHVARHCKTANNHNRVILRYLILMCCRVAQRSYIVQEVSHYISNAKLKPMEYRFCDLLCFSGDPRVLDTFIQILNYAKFKPP